MTHGFSRAEPETLDFLYQSSTTDGRVSRQQAARVNHNRTGVPNVRGLAIAGSSGPKKKRLQDFLLLQEQQAWLQYAAVKGANASEERAWSRNPVRVLWASTSIHYCLQAQLGACMCWTQLDAGWQAQKAGDAIPELDQAPTSPPL